MFNKKVLLPFSAVVFSSALIAEGTAPSLKISGSASMDASVNSQKKKKSDEKASRSPMLSIGVADLYFTTEGKTECGLTYKWRFNINAVPNITPTLDRNYLEFGYDDYGIVQFGAVSGADDTMAVSALKLIGGAVSIDGTFGGAYNFSSGVIGGVHPIGYTKRANKIVYMTPRFNGFQLGVSYAPNSSRHGRSEEQGIGHDSGLYLKKVDDLFGQNNVAVGLSYKNTWDDISVSLATTGITERSRLKVNGQRVDLHNTLSYQVGAHVRYKDITVGGSFINNKKSRLPKTAGQTIIPGKLTSDQLMHGNAGKMWDAGVQYVYESWQFATAFFHSKRKINVSETAQSKVLAFTVDKKVYPGLKLFAEVDFASSKTTQNIVNLANNIKSDSGIDNNSGKMFIVGAFFSF